MPGKRSTLGMRTDKFSVGLTGAAATGTRGFEILSTVLNLSLDAVFFSDMDFQFRH